MFQVLMTVLCDYLVDKNLSDPDTLKGVLYFFT